MKRHAKATSAGSTQRQAKSLGSSILFAVALLITMIVVGVGQALAASAPSAEAFASEAERKEALLGAEINPNGEATTYQFQYVDAAHYKPLEADPYEEGDVAPSVPKSIGSETSPIKVTQRIEGLSPGTTYHYRVVAENALGTTPSPDHTIVTPPANAEPETNCPNQQFRIGPSANLPDCRAYEMVSPIEKGGAGILPAGQGAGGSRRSFFDQAAVDGDKITYTSGTSFGDEPSNRNANQYMATRGPDGWSTHGISAYAPGTVLSEASAVGTFAFDTPFFYFSPNLSNAWLLDTSDPALTSDAVEGFANIYRRDNLTDTYHEPALTSEPLLWAESQPGWGRLLAESTGYGSIQGENAPRPGGHDIFSAAAQLTPDAPANLDRRRIYDAHDGEISLISMLPGEVPATEDAWVGAYVEGPHALAGEQFRHNDRAVSADGSRVFFSVDGVNSSAGKLYARIDDERTVAVSESVTSEPDAIFQTANVDGSTVVFTAGSDLYEYDVDTETPTLIAHEVTGVPGGGEDLSYLYFVSRAVLDPGASAGEENLYVRHDGANSFVATLAPRDVTSPEGERLSLPTIAGGNFSGPLNRLGGQPLLMGNRITPNGSHIAFMSRAPLTGYDNTDALTGEAATEVFLYDAVAGKLRCVSCNPSGGRPHGGYTKSTIISATFEVGSPEVTLREIEENPGFIPKWRTAAWIPGWDHVLHASHLLADDGSRIFFNADDALVPQDTNGRQDVYEWEETGTGGCEVGGYGYSAQDEGCLYLITTGKSGAYSELIDASADGNDVFVRTESSINPADPGLFDIYDARVGGGYPLSTKITACEGEACQSPPAAPNDPTPGSASYRGPGNVVEAPSARKHHKKNRKRRHHHRRHARAHNRANNDRRAAR